MDSGTAWDNNITNINYVVQFLVIIILQIFAKLERIDFFSLLNNLSILRVFGYFQ